MALVRGVPFADERTASICGSRLSAPAGPDHYDVAFLGLYCGRTTSPVTPMT